MKPRGKSRGGVVVKVVPKESFFNFFAALEVPADAEELDEEEVGGVDGCMGGLGGYRFGVGG
jgi:hypothetical protein